MVDGYAERALDVVAIEVANEVRWWERVAAGVGYVEPGMLSKEVSPFRVVVRVLMSRARGATVSWKGVSYTYRK